MKRNMDLIRLQLLQLEGEQVDLSPYSEDDLTYNMAQIIDAGLAYGEVIREGGFPVTTSAFHLTWAGHEFLDAARNETVWNKVKGQLKDKGVSWSFELLKFSLLAYGKAKIAEYFPSILNDSNA